MRNFPSWCAIKKCIHHTALISQSMTHIHIFVSHYIWRRTCTSSSTMLKVRGRVSMVMLLKWVFHLWHLLHLAPSGSFLYRDWDGNKKSMTAQQNHTVDRLEATTWPRGFSSDLPKKSCPMHRNIIWMNLEERGRPESAANTVSVLSNCIRIEKKESYQTRCSWSRSGATPVKLIVCRSIMKYFTLSHMTAIEAHHWRS